MRLDHLLSRENLENLQSHIQKGNLKRRISFPAFPQHPASRAPSDETALSPGETPGAHLDSCIATERKRDLSECEVLRDSRIDAILRDQPIVQGEIYYVVQPIGRLPKRRCQGRTADALAQEADEGRGKLR